MPFPDRAPPVRHAERRRRWHRAFCARPPAGGRPCNKHGVDARHMVVVPEIFANILNVSVPDGGGEVIAPRVRAAAAAQGAAGDIAWLSQGYAFDIGFLGEPVSVRAA